MVDDKIPTGGTTVGYDDLLQISVPEEIRTQRTSPIDLFRSSSTARIRTCSFIFGYTVLPHQDERFSETRCSNELPSGEDRIRTQATEYNPVASGDLRESPSPLRIIQEQISGARIACPIFTICRLTSGDPAGPRTKIALINLG